jgi:hypothetical protein
VSGNPVLATNVLFIGGSALTAWTIGLVATRWTRSAAAGTIAGATYLAAPWVLQEWVPGCPHFAMLMWLPLIIDRASRPSLRLRGALALAVMIALQGAVEVVYLAPAVFAPLALLVIVRLRRRADRVSAMYLGGALVAAAIMLSPVVWEHFAVRRANPGLEQQTPWRDFKEAPVAPPARDLVLPWSLFGWWQQAGDHMAAPPPMAIPPLAFGVIACGVLSCMMRHRWGDDERAARAWRHAALWTAAGIVLGLPLRAAVFGTSVPLPYLWLISVLPDAHVLRVPMRLGVVGLVALSLLTGLAFGEVLRRVLRRWQARPRGRVIRGVVAVGIAVAILEQPRTGWGYPPGFVIQPRAREYPLYPIPRETPYATALHAGRGPLLEIGKGLFGLPQEHLASESTAMIRSIGHWRPLLNGYSSYWPQQYERSMGLARRLPEDLDALSALRRETGVELILVWPDQLPEGKRTAWRDLARSEGNSALTLVRRNKVVALLFRVTGA